MRRELGITDDEHRIVLEELGIEDPELLSPNRQRSLENLIRLSGYRKSLERLMLLQSKQSNDLRSKDDHLTTLNKYQLKIQTQSALWDANIQLPLKKKIGFWVDSRQTQNRQKAEFLLAQLPDLIEVIVF